MDNVFDFRNRLISEYSSFSRSFSKVAAQDILSKVEGEYDRGRYWPEPLIQINPNYKRQGTVQQLAQQGVLHAHCADIFRTGKTEGKFGRPAPVCAPVAGSGQGAKQAELRGDHGHGLGQVACVLRTHHRPHSESQGRPIRKSARAPSSSTP
jgi:hypothetical protein